MGLDGMLTNLIDIDKSDKLPARNPLQTYLIAFKCISSCIATEDSKLIDKFMKEHISQLVIKLLLKGSVKSQDEFLYCKVNIITLRS